MSKTVGRLRGYAVVVLLCGCAVAAADDGFAGIGNNGTAAATRSVDEFLS